MPACLAWSDNDESWKEDGIGVDIVSAGDDGAANVTCRTYHLSTFATSETAGTSLDFVIDDLSSDLEVLRKVGGRTKSRRMWTEAAATLRSPVIGTVRP